MNKTAKQTEALLAELSAKLPDTRAEVMVAPVFVNLAQAVSSLGGSKIEVVAQNMHFADSGAYTGEVAADMLLDIGVKTAILGHSERRAYFGEDDALLAKKVQQALGKQMRVIFCFGEELADRKAGNHFKVVESQLKNALFALPADAWKQIVLAYEPVWAIGTGETASPEQAQEMHAFIRQLIGQRFTGQQGIINDGIKIDKPTFKQRLRHRLIQSRPDLYPRDDWRPADRRCDGTRLLPKQIRPWLSVMWYSAQRHRQSSHRHRHS